ncbi:MAG: 4'-phosphopantetheinyl transferase [Leptospiraceae bacterium]|nr:MAG: 4'-phosphopantetheinyl transferase [Leptospiraceae bacterium]
MNIFLSTNDVIYGNDIVDLNVPDTSIEHLNLRFINKICTENEKKNFFSMLEKPTKISLKEMLVNLWTIWSLKESSYKTVSRIYFIPFRYKEFEVQKGFNNTIYKKFLLNNIIYNNSDFILTLTYFSGKMNLNKTSESHFIFLSWLKIKNELQREYENYSHQIRKYINQTLYNIFKIKTKVFRKYAQEEEIFMPPYLYFDKKFYPISLSHHGRFLLFTLAIKKDNLSIFSNYYYNQIIKISKNHYLIIDKN